MSDRKFGVSSGGSSLIDHYEPHIVTAQDYYPFGMMSRVNLSGKSYTFGFNGQMMTNDVKGGLGNSYTAQYWEYDSRIGRRWNLDPIIRPQVSPYSVFHNNSIYFSDPNGDDPPEKPNRFIRFWRAMNNEFYKTRAEEYANANNIDDKNIVNLGNTWVVINDKNQNDIRFSIFRQSKKDGPVVGGIFGDLTSPKNDDLNLTKSQFLNTQVKGDDVITTSLPAVGGASAVGNAIMMGGKSRLAILGIVDKTAKALQSFRKYIRFGKEGHPDVLKKGYHLHFDEIAQQLEMGLRPLDAGKIGLVQVGKLSVGTAADIKKAVDIFSQAMANSKFRAELLVRLKATQEYLKQTFKAEQEAQLAIDKAHEINYLIKAIENF